MSSIWGEGIREFNILLIKRRLKGNKLFIPARTIVDIHDRSIIGVDAVRVYFTGRNNSMTLEHLSAEDADQIVTYLNKQFEETKNKPI